MTLNTTFQIDSVYDVGTTILSAVSVALSGTAAGPVNRVLMYPGSAPVWDECDCGQLAMGVTTHFNSRDMVGDASSQFMNCVGPARVARYSLSIVRCIPGPDINGLPPSPGALTNAFKIQQEDAYVVWHTVQCQLTTLQDTSQPGGPVIGGGLMLDQTVLTAQGSCSGTELHFQIAWWRDDCGC